MELYYKLDFLRINMINCLKKLKKREKTGVYICKIGQDLHVQHTESKKNSTDKKSKTN